jgi:hypothetical protein
MRNLLRASNVHSAVKVILRIVLFSLVASWLLSEPAGVQSEPMNCQSDAGKEHATLSQGDQNSAGSLRLARRIAPGASVDLEVCYADLTILGGKDDILKVTTTLGKPAAKRAAGDYLQQLDVSEHVAGVQLHLPESVHAKVVVVLPAGTSKLKVNLVRGALSFRTDHVRGERTINLVSGHVDVLGNADSYKDLQVNVALGSFHDHRDGASGHGVMVSKSLTGTGSGSIAVRVEKGSVDLKAWD